MNRNDNFEARVEARLAFSNRRKYILDAWLEGAGLESLRMAWAESLERCNDAEIAMLGGLW